MEAAYRSAARALSAPRMKIGVLTNDYPPSSKGGAGVIAERYARALQQRQHDVRIFFYPPTFLRQSVVTRLLAHLRDLCARKEIVREILAWKPDVLLTHNLTGCGMATPRAIQRHGIRWAHMLHDVQLIDLSGRFVFGESFRSLRSVWRKMWASLRRNAFGSPDTICSPTQWLLRVHERYGFFRTSQKQVIPNPIDEIKTTFLSWDERPRSILYVGRTDPDKGIDVLLQAWQMMNEPRPHLDIIGDGVRFVDRDQYQHSSLAFHGRLSAERVAEFMGRSRVVVIPSLVAENQPTVALEALAEGCSVVGSDVGGMKETLEDAGWIVPPNNAELLQQTLLLALDTPPSHERIYRVLEAHRPDVVVDALEAALKSNL